MLPLLPALALSTTLHLLAAPAPAPPVTRFGGHLEHAPAGDTVRLFVGERRVKAPLGPGGDFQFEFKDLPGTTPVHFTYAGQSTRLYLMPGDQLRMTLDFKDFDKSLVYSGQGSDVNNYLAQSQRKFEYSPPGDDLRPLDRLKQNPRMTPAEMRRNADAFRQRRRAFLAEYAKAHPLPAAFRRDAEFGIDLAWGTQLLDYLGFSRAQNTAESGPNQPVNPAYFSFVPQLPLRELGQHMRGLDENTAVAQFLYAYQDRLVPSGKLSTDPAEGPRLYKLATQELGEGKILNMAMQMLMGWKIDADVAGAQVFYRTFKQHNADSTLARDLRLSMAKKQNLSPGKLAPAFTLRDTTGKAVSLSDFKGKVVYLDFWGTWCGPCMQEMTESAPALKKQFEGREVVFLYVSMGDPEDRWKQTLLDKQFTSANSVHLREPRESRQVATDYQVNVYPTYWLIGRDGRIVDTHAPRPSDGPKTVAAIEAALKN
ncbi:TlpA family protein disulfide reductase [Hymenobacter sp. BRD128]|uniref:TlpA family protein disulfide reductase n=1 Tax=Hymenobacter sp. BRD128 TaxID=2675878 RepID=UPI0015648202|nr:TlpA disulfide reductase family protein [Hymenobacter sp. BRD128]QKG56815.1 TlpA family protein disulfide reductase [Hymenobacter sp. BRD128]